MAICTPISTTRFFGSRKYSVAESSFLENIEKIFSRQIAMPGWSVANRFSFPIIVSTHPRTRKRLEELNPSGLSPRISFSKPFGFFDYIQLSSSQTNIDASRQTKGNMSEGFK